MECIAIIFGIGFGALVVARLALRSNKDWSQLYCFYPGDAVTLKTKGLQLQRMKLGEGYSCGCVGLAADANGILITSCATRTVKGQPLYIPYSDILVTSKKTQSVPQMQILRVKKAPNVEIALSKHWTDIIKNATQTGSVCVTPVD